MALDVAPELLKTNQDRSARAASRASGPPLASMNKELQIRFTAVVLALLTVTAATFAVLNFSKERQLQIPVDGVWWVEQAGHLVAQRVDSDGPGERAGIKQQDRLRGVDGRSVSTVAGLERQFYRVGVWSQAKYQLTRGSIPLETQVVLVLAEKYLYLV